MSRTGKSIEKASRVVAAGGLGAGGAGVTGIGDGCSFGEKMKMFWNYIELMIA